MGLPRAFTDEQPAKCKVHSYIYLFKQKSVISYYIYSATHTKQLLMCFFCFSLRASIAPEIHSRNVSCLCACVGCIRDASQTASQSLLNISESKNAITLAHNIAECAVPGKARLAQTSCLPFGFCVSFWHAVLSRASYNLQAHDHKLFHSHSAIPIRRSSLGRIYTRLAHVLRSVR